MAKAQKIRVVVADDHAILRAGLRMLINAQGDMTVVAEAQDGIEAVAAVQRTKPDVAILDVTMPRSGGLDAIKEIVSRSRSTRILLLTMHEEPAYLRTALSAGASGYVLKRAWTLICLPQSAPFIKGAPTSILNLPRFWFAMRSAQRPPTEMVPREKACLAIASCRS